MAKGPLRKKKRGWLIWLLVLAAVATGSFMLFRTREQKPIEVVVHQVERGTVRDLVSSSATGRVAGRREVQLRAELSGTVSRLHHRRGERVGVGEPLVGFDPDDLRDRLRVAQAQSQLGRAQAAQAAASQKIAERNAQRTRQLLKSEAISQAEGENVEGQLDVAAKAAEAAKAGFFQAQASAELARHALSKSVLRAPFEGVILATGVEEGEVVSPGLPLISLADVGELHVDAELDESDVARVLVGQTAELSLDALPGEKLSGAVREVAPSVSRDARANRSVAFEVNLPPDPRLRVGMSADVDVIVSTREGVLWVPPVAVVGRGAERSVFVVEGDTARKRSIEAGISTWEAVEVVKGLSPGDRVVVNLATAPNLADGAKVKIRTGAAAAGAKVGALR